ncbi:hypothetical protein HaLaN_20707 [Haematococcus lacustris]|uniref:Uncharacterized protein n=1 Tax=Haematococcus lacustris TaxID=44745 RepID=A0A699ZLN0_HAELA|nr:hypothetical protein HaLaN_20707 [Haematococcus lacustris]
MHLALHPVLYVLSSLGTAVLVIKRNVRPTDSHPGRRSSDSSEQTCEPLSGAACTAHSTRASSSSATSSSHSYSPSQLSSQQQLLLCRHNDAQDCAKQIVSGGVVTLPSFQNSLLSPVLPWQAHRHQVCHSPAVLPPLPVGGGHGITAAAGAAPEAVAGQGLEAEVGTPAGVQWTGQRAGAWAAIGSGLGAGQGVGNAAGARQGVGAGQAKGSPSGGWAQPSVGPCAPHPQLDMTGPHHLALTQLLRQLEQQLRCELTDFQLAPNQFAAIVPPSAQPMLLHQRMQLSVLQHMLQQDRATPSSTLHPKPANSSPSPLWPNHPCGSTIPVAHPAGVAGQGLVPPAGTLDLGQGAGPCRQGGHKRGRAAAALPPAQHAAKRGPAAH